MRKIFKNLIAGMATLSLCVAGAGVITASATQRTLSTKLMGVDTATPNSASSQKRLSDADVGKEFWLGVTADNLDDSITDHELFTNGLHTLEISFEYNMDYIQPYTTGTDTEGSFNSALQAGNLKSGTATDDAEWWDADSYTITSVVQTDINDHPKRKSETRGSSTLGWKMCEIRIAYNGSDFTKARFKGLTGDTADKTLVKVPFKLISAPPAGTNIYPLYIVKGPETFSMGGGESGYDPYYQWYDDNAFKPDLNLKLLFEDKTDSINLFGVGASISDIQYLEPTPEPTTPPEPDPTPKPLSKTDAISNDGFESETYGAANPYYISVPYEDDYIKLCITSTNVPDVKFDDGTPSGQKIDIDTSIAGVHTTKEIALTPLDPATKATDNGFVNKVTVSDGTREYIILIRRLIKPKIVLNYGNSPVGMIMNNGSLTEQEKQDAIDDFKTNRVFSGVENNLKYYEDAWKSYDKTHTDSDGNPYAIDNDGNPADYNGDDDPTAIFIYQRETFCDPGYHVYDSLGDEVSDNNVSITLTMTAVNDGFMRYTSAENPHDVSLTNPVTETKHVFDDFVNDNIRPDVYTMTYTYTDLNANATVVAKRKVIAIIQNGDVYVNAMKVVNGQDANFINGNTDYFDTNTVNSLYKYRVADTYINDMKVINGQDANFVSAANDAPVHNFYQPLVGS